MPDIAAKYDLWQPVDNAQPLDHWLLRARVIDRTISTPLPSAQTRIQVCVRGEGGRLRSVDPSAMTTYIVYDLMYGVSARIAFDQTVVKDGTEVFVELADREGMSLCGRGWADDAGEEDAGCPDYDSFMSVLERA